MLDVDCFDFTYPAKNPVIADFTESITKQTEMCKKKCCILIIIGISFTENFPEALFELFQIMCPGSGLGVG